MMFWILPLLMLLPYGRKSLKWLPSTPRTTTLLIYVKYHHIMNHPAKRHSGSRGGTGLYRGKKTNSHRSLYKNFQKKNWFLGKVCKFSVFWTSTCKFCDDSYKTYKFRAYSLWWSTPSVVCVCYLAMSFAIRHFWCYGLSMHTYVCLPSMQKWYSSGSFLS